MNPAQKFLLGCRQTSEAAARLTGWLDLNPALLGAGHGAVREDLEGLAARLGPLALAADAVPCIGLISTESGAKNDLLFSMLAGRAAVTVGEFGQRPLETSTIRSLLPQDGEAGGCAVLRFSKAEMPPAPRGYPIRAALLSMIDVAAIMARAAYAARYQVARQPEAGEIEALFGEMAGRLSPQAIPGLSAGDVLELRETLGALLPDHRLLPALAATRYWTRFREIAPHISDRDRRRVLAVLWRDDAAFTALFDRLCDGLELLGHGAEAYCAPDALIGKDKTSGWMTRHPRSIIHAGTLLGLSDHEGPAINVMNRYGQGVDIERAVMAGLIAELPLHLGASRLSDIAPAEILDFPVPPPIGAGPGAGIAANDDIGAAAGMYARTKAIHLFERASARRDVTSLVVVVNPDAEDDTYTAALGDWVDSAQGQTAHARERVRRGLFIAARLPQARRGFGGEDLAEAEELVRRNIRDVIGEGQAWPLAWTPNRPMSDVYWFDGSDAGPPAAGGWQPGTGLAVAQTPQHGALMAAPTAGGAAGELIPALVMASDVRMRQVQLNQALAEIRRRLHMCVLRHHASNDPAALSDWRRGMAVVVQDRLQLIKENGRLGHLQRALLPSESDLATAIVAGMPGKRGEAAGSGMGTGGTWLQTSRSTNPAGGGAIAAIEGCEWTPQKLSRMAEGAVEHWFLEMRRAARSGRLCRELRIEPRILHNVVDELQIGAIRTALSSEIATAFQRAPGDRPTGEAQVVRLASYAYRIINAYLEILAAPTGRGKQQAARGMRALPTEGEVAEAASGGYATIGARSRGISRRAARPSLEPWDVSFAGLVEDNIASAHLMAGRGDKDRELGELIQLFASGPFEVEL